MLKKYGIPLLKHKGKCTLISVMGTEIKGRFECIQLNDSDMYVLVLISKREQIKNWPKIQDFSSRNSASKINNITGITSDGMKFQTDGNVNLLRLEDFFPDGHKPTKLVFHIQSFSITNFQNIKKPYLIRFHLTNLVFTGADWHWKIKDRSGFRKTVFKIGRSLFTLFPRSDYKTRIEELKVKKFSNVTSYLDIKLGRKRVETVVNQVNNLCLLLSFAKGTQINWIYYELFDRDNVLTQSIHNYRVTRIYSSLKIIADDSPKALLEFINDTFPRFTELLKQYPMNKLIGTIITAKMDGSFIELRALILASMVDVLCGVWARLNNRVYIMDTKQFDKQLDVFKLNLSQFLEKELKVTSVQAEAMSEHARGLNYYTFRSTLKRIIKEFSAQIEYPEISKFVASRNNLVHEGEFLSSNNIVEFLEVVSFADRLILGMLGYRGDFKDLHMHFLK